MEVTAAIIKDRDAILICRRPAGKQHPLLWEFPGGKMEPGETPEQCVVRECREELDITLEVLAPFATVTRREKGEEVRIQFFLCALRQGKPKAMEHQDMQWIRPAQWREFSFCPADEEMVKKLERETGQAEFDLQDYLVAGVEGIVKGALRATVKNPRESLFLARFAKASAAASRRRKTAEERGEHIPPFLIASITSLCNLHCAGCYARANHACSDKAAAGELTAGEWRDIFLQAADLGISFILLAGGEPLLRRDVVEAAGGIPDILFPIFTNATLLGRDYLDLFALRRNLVPIVSIEGNQETTDRRRGAGTYQGAAAAVEGLKKRGILFGASVTVTTENLGEVTDPGFLQKLYDSGCRVVIYVEFVPVTPNSRDLAPGETEREVLRERLAALRKTFGDMVLVSFPGDERSSGGCLAAGRGFFHVDAQGGAEPCPFSPYSDTSLRRVSLREALRSPFFSALREGGTLLEDHAGGCVLFEKQDLVKRLLEEGAGS